MDAIQGRFRREAIRFEAAVATQASLELSGWQMRQVRRTLGYTTDWEGVVKVN